MKSIDVLSLGSIYLDINCLGFPVENLKVETETLGDEYRVEPGGSAVIAPRVMAKLGLKPAFIGKVGSDAFGTLVTDLLTQTGIEPHLISSSANTTSTSINFVSPEGKAVMTTVGNANQSLTAGEIIRKLEELLPQCTFLYIGGFFKLKQLAQSWEKIFTLAKESDTKIIMDHGRVVNTVTSEQISQLKELISNVDIYLPSEDEFFEVWQVESVEQGFEVLRRHKIPYVVVKQGTKGATGMTSQGEIQHADIFIVKPKNTIGAGDSFNAGFVKAHTLNKSFADSLKFAAATAALKISQPELPTVEEVERLIQ